MLRSLARAAGVMVYPLGGTTSRVAGPEYTVWYGQFHLTTGIAQCLSFITFYGGLGTEGCLYRPAGGIDSSQSIPGLRKSLKSLKIPSQLILAVRIQKIASGIFRDDWNFETHLKSETVLY